VKHYNPVGAVFGEALISCSCSINECVDFSFLYPKAANPATTAIMSKMSPFRAKKLDLGGFLNTNILRDHTKRKVFEQFEPQR
jgi:hypothetical protein